MKTVNQENFPLNAIRPAFKDQLTGSKIVAVPKYSEVCYPVSFIRLSGLTIDLASISSINCLHMYRRNHRYG